jgi:hypothetical protein
MSMKYLILVLVALIGAVFANEATVDASTLTSPTPLTVVA